VTWIHPPILHLLFTGDTVYPARFWGRVIYVIGGYDVIMKVHIYDHGKPVLAFEIS